MSEKPLGVLADTHDNLVALQRALGIFQQHGVTTILHAGDLVSLGTLEYFRGFDFYFVRGNNDPPLIILKQKANELNFNSPETYLTLEFYGRRIFLTHGDDVALFREVTASHNPYGLHYLIKGHTHMPEDYRRSGIRILNPGPLHRARNYTAALLWPASDTWKLVDVT